MRKLVVLVSIFLYFINITFADIDVTGYKTLNVKFLGIKGDKSKFYSSHFGETEGFKYSSETYVEINGEAAEGLIVNGYIRDIPDTDRQVLINLLGRNFSLSIGDTKTKFMDDSELGLKTTPIRGLNFAYKLSDNLTLSGFFSQLKGKSYYEEIPTNPYVSKYKLKNSPIVAGSCKVYLDNQLLKEGIDYVLDEEFGEIILRPHLMPLPENSRLKVSYKYEDDFFGVFSEKFAGVGLDYKIGGFKFNLGFVTLGSDSNDDSKSVIFGDNDYTGQNLYNVLTQAKYKGKKIELGSSLVGSIFKKETAKKGLAVTSYLNYKGKKLQIGLNHNLVSTDFKGLSANLQPKMFDELKLGFDFGNIKSDLKVSNLINVNNLMEQKTRTNVFSGEFGIGFNFNKLRLNFLTNINKGDLKENSIQSRKTFLANVSFLLGIANFSTSFQFEEKEDYSNWEKTALMLQLPVGFTNLNFGFEKATDFDKYLFKLSASKNRVYLNGDFSLVDKDNQKLNYGQLKADYRGDIFNLGILSSMNTSDDNNFLKKEMKHRLTAQWDFSKVDFATMLEYRYSSLMQDNLNNDNKSLFAKVRTNFQIFDTTSLELERSSDIDLKTKKENDYSNTITLRQNFSLFDASLTYQDGKKQDLEQLQLNKNTSVFNLGLELAKQTGLTSSDNKRWVGLFLNYMGKRINIENNFRLEQFENWEYKNRLTGNVNANFTLNSQITATLGLQLEKADNDYEAWGMDFKFTHHF